MKAILVMFDSLNRHFLPNYGNDWVQAPNFERLGKMTTTFDRCYVGSMPCMPARREIHTGRYNFLHRSWGPLEPFDDSMVELLKRSGIYTHLVTDHYHYWEDGGATYHNRYNSYVFSRGQEGDKWKGLVDPPEIPQHYGQFRLHDWINRQYIRGDHQLPQTKTFQAGIEFIEQNHQSDNWFLQIETFDPHEPFYTAEEWYQKYPHEYDGPHFDWPNYAEVTEPRDAVEHVRKEYAAVVSKCDDSLGKVLDKMDQYQLWDDTLLIVCTDHGFMLGEHNLWAKCHQPFYNEIAHTPFFLWDPRHPAADERRQALIQTIDIAPTVLDYFQIEPPASVLGKPLAPCLESDQPVRQAGLFGQFGAHISVTDGRYVYMQAPVDESDIFEYTLMPTHMTALFSTDELAHTTIRPPFSFTKNVPVMKIRGRNQHGSGENRATSLLFDLEADPHQDHPIDDPEIKQRMIAMMLKLLAENDAPEEVYSHWGLK